MFYIGNIFSTIHLLAELSTDVTEALDSIKTHRFQTSVAQHLGHLGDTGIISFYMATLLLSTNLSILLTILLEHKFSLETLILVFPSPPVLSSFSLVLGHDAMRVSSH